MTDISIIVPVYNTEMYLRECIDSILTQAYTDFEVLLIDDGSTDRSGEICDEYAQKDSRIRVFHKENGGVSSARNLGLENAKGEWMCFVDSDDTIPTDALTSYMKNLGEDVDLIISKYIIYKESGEVVTEYSKYDGIIKISQKDILKEMYAVKWQDYQGFIWSKLMRLSVIKKHNLRFNERIYFNEDRLFTVQFICHSGKNVKFINHCTYKYIQRVTGSIASLKDGYNRDFVTDFDALILMKKEIEKLSFGKELRWYTIRGIRKSYDWNHKMMMQFGDYNSRNHWHMLWGMIKCGAFIPHIKDAIRPFMIIIIPKLFVKHGIDRNYRESSFMIKD